MHNFDNTTDSMMIDENENLIVKPVLDDFEPDSKLDMCFGSFDVQKTFEKTNYFKIQSGSNIFRIMPPMFDAIEKGAWAVYYSEHYGFLDSKNFKRKFICTRRYNSNREFDRCLFCEDQDAKKKQEELLVLKIKELEDNILILKRKNQDSSAFLQLEENLNKLKQELDSLKKYIKTRNTFFYVNAMDQSGKFGVLGLKKTVYEILAGEKDQSSGYRGNGLLKEIKKMEGIDPLSPNEGVWFDIIRTGTDFQNTKYKVETVKEAHTYNGQKFYSIKKAPLSNSQKQAALNKCHNLMRMYDNLRLTLEEQNLVINGGPEAVTAVLNSPTRKFNYKKDEQTISSKKNSLDDFSYLPSVSSEDSISYLPSNEELKSMIG